MNMRDIGDWRRRQPLARDQREDELKAGLHSLAAGNVQRRDVVFRDDACAQLSKRTLPPDQDLVRRDDPHHRRRHHDADDEHGTDDERDHGDDHLRRIMREQARREAEGDRGGEAGHHQPLRDRGAFAKANVVGGDGVVHCGRLMSRPRKSTDRSAESSNIKARFIRHRLSALSSGERGSAQGGGRPDHFGASHSLRPNEITVTAPTPPSQRTANHISRRPSGVASALCGISDNRSRPGPCRGRPNRPSRCSQE